MSDLSSLKSIRPAILGGTFNPIHNGHLMLAREVLQMGFDTILFTPALIPAHKTTPLETTAEQRIEMIRLAISEENKMDLSLCEIERGGISYSIDTVRFINKKYNIPRCGLIIGDDQAEVFDSWKFPEELSAESEILVAHRKYKEKLSLPFPCRYIDNTIFEVSSTEIRRELSGQKFRSENQSEKPSRNIKDRELLPKKVRDYIENHGLYRNN